MPRDFDGGGRKGSDGSEVSTVTESWFDEHLRGRPLQQTSWLSVRAANGLDIPYVGLLEGRIRVFRQECHAFDPVQATTDRSPSGNEHSPAAPSHWPEDPPPPPWIAPPPLIEAAIRATTLHCQTVVGLARVAGTTRVPAHSITTVRVRGAQRRALVAEPCHHPLPPGLMLVPVLVGGDRSLYHVRVANLTDEDIVLQGRTPVAALHAVDSVDNDITVHVSSQTLHVGIQEPVPLTHPDLSAKLQNFQGTAQEKQQLLDLFMRYPNAISHVDMDLGYTDRELHSLRTTDDNPTAQIYRSILPRDLHKVKSHIQDILAKGVVTPSHSPYAAPVVVVRKKDGSIRLCVDYRGLNSKTVKDAYPLPRIEESFNALAGSKYFTTLDLASGYHQIAMDPKDQDQDGLHNTLRPL